MNNILIVIDIQNGFMNDKTVQTYNKISELLKNKIFNKVIATKYKNVNGSNIEKMIGWTNLRSKKSQEIMPEVYKLCDCVTVKEDCYSAYTKEMIEKLKEENGNKLPYRIFICGLDTECCVLKTAVDFFENGIRPIVLSNYCFSTAGQKYHDAGILCLTRLIGKYNIVDGEISTKERLDNLIDILKDKN